MSRLHFSDRELEIFETQVAGILDFIEKLKEIDVDEVAPTSHPMALTNVFRPDQIRPSVSMEDFIRRSPKSSGSFFEVPKVIEDNP